MTRPSGHQTAFCADVGLGSRIGDLRGREISGDEAASTRYTVRSRSRGLAATRATLPPPSSSPGRTTLRGWPSRRDDLRLRSLGPVRQIVCSSRSPILALLGVREDGSFVQLTQRPLSLTAGRVRLSGGRRRSADDGCRLSLSMSGSGVSSLALPLLRHHHAVADPPRCPNVGATTPPGASLWRASANALSVASLHVPLAVLRQVRLPQQLDC